MSRWLVGSSRAITSHSPMSNCASCTRRRWPPLNVETVASQSISETSPSTTSRTRASPAHWWSGWSPTSVQPTVWPGSRMSAWLSALTRNPLRWVTRPECGLDLAGEHAEQAGFAVPVSADDADPRAVVHPERDRIEDHLVRICQVYCLGSEQVCHWTEATDRAIRTTVLPARRDCGDLLPRQGGRSATMSAVRQ